MTFYSEIIAYPRGISISIDSIFVWDPPHMDKTIDIGKRSEIIDNMKRAFYFWGVEVEFIENRQ